MPLGQPMCIFGIVVLLALLLALTAPLWMKGLNGLGNLIKRQLQSGADVFDQQKEKEEEKEQK